MSKDYDIIVIGGGHAGAEAAWAAARLGARTALVTFSRAAIGRMSCNPAIGGIGKGQMVREIDALGGLMGVVTDQTGIQFRMLNQRKGPAVWAPRAQADREDYAVAVQAHLAACQNLMIIEAGVERILAEQHSEAPRLKTLAIERDATTPECAPQRVVGVELADGCRLSCAAVIVTSGTFLRGLMHTGEAKSTGGRIGESAAVGLSASLAELGLEMGRLKTGTPPRLQRDTIDFARLEAQPGDPEPFPFSFLTDRIDRPQIECWITYTNDEIHELIRANLHRAPMYSGQIQSRGPRYCPSIEDKVVRFADKSQHQLFLEPEGRNSDRIYVNGISTSLPQDVQAEIVRRVPGLERAHVLQWGYAVEYDFVPPEQIDATLMTKRVAGLFLAGQINGTSGYEEAAGQGLIAGINAARWAAGRSPVTLGRDQAYIGVMIDDLVTRGVTEPYRMFTSRAEHRLHLRYDNADQRLTPLGRSLGLVRRDRWERYEARRAALSALLAAFQTTRVAGVSIHDWLKRPEEDGARFVAQFPHYESGPARRAVWEAAVVVVKYAGYLEREQRAMAQFRELEDQAIPYDLDYRQVPNLRYESVERWSAVRPGSLGQAARVSGVHPTDVTILMLHLRDRERIGNR